MKRVFCGVLALSVLLLGCAAASAEEAPAHKLLYQGHGSLRITTAEGKVIYIDPYAGEGYDVPADLILVTHGHSPRGEADQKEKQGLPDHYLEGSPCERRV